MGFYKNLATEREQLRRFNAARRRAAKLGAAPSSRLIRLETVSETERHSFAQDADLVTAFNEAVEKWQNSVMEQLRAEVSLRSTRIGKELQPRAYTDKYGLINRLGFSFPRHGIYLHYGAGRGQGGYTGSKWVQHKRINGIEVSTGIVKHTNPSSLNGSMGLSPRKAFPWFDPIVESRLSDLSDIVTQYFDTMIIDASKIFIEK